MNVASIDRPDRIPYRLTELWKHQEGDDDSVYVMDGMEGHIYQLNVTAGHLWMLIDGKRTLGDIITVCLDNFETNDLNEAKALLLECMDDLHSRGLVAFEDE